MAGQLREGATKKVGGKRYKVKNGKWVQVSNSTSRQTVTSSSNRSQRSNRSNASQRVTNSDSSGVRGSNSASRSGAVTNSNSSPSQRGRGSSRTTGYQPQGPSASQSRTAPSVSKPKTTKAATPKPSTARTATTAARTGLLGAAGRVVPPIIAGQTIAGYMAENSRQGVSTSGRGSGRAAFRDGNKNANVMQPKPSNRSNNNGSDGTTFRERMGINGNPKLNPGHPSNRTPKSSTKEGARTVKASRRENATPVPGSTQPSRTNSNNSNSSRSGDSRRTGRGSSQPARQPQSPNNMDENYKRWAKANPKLAAKVKKGQAGYDAIKGSGSSSSSTKGSSNGAPGASGAAQREQQRQAQAANPKSTKKATSNASKAVNNAKNKDKKKKRLLSGRPLNNRNVG